MPGLTVDLMNLTEPSRNAIFTPPGWFDLARDHVPDLVLVAGVRRSAWSVSWLLPQQFFWFGVWTWLYPPPSPVPVDNQQ